MIINSVNDSIEIKASQKIVLQAGQASLTLEGGDIRFACPGTFSAKGGTLGFPDRENSPAMLTQLPEGELPRDTLYLNHLYHDDQPLAGADYFAKLADGSQRTGKLDGQGRTIINGVPSGSAQVSFSPMPETLGRMDKTPMPNHDPDPSQEKIDSLFAQSFKSGEVNSTSGNTDGGTNQGVS